MPAGRPSKYDPAMCETVIQCGREGMGKAEMAAELGIAYSNFDRWQHEHPEFQDAVKEAVRQSQAWWEKMGRVSTFGGTDGFNATSYIFQMKNRFRADWNDTVKSEHSGPDGGAIIQKIERVIIDPKD
jgi:transposase